MFRTIRSLQQTLPDFPRSVPNLQSLTVDRLGVLKGCSADPFESLTPSLQSFSLTGVHFYPSFLRLNTLTELTLNHNKFNLHLDTLLDFLEGNDSLKSATLHIRFADPSLLNSRRDAAIVNQLQHLSISTNPAEGKALVSNIALRRAYT